MGEMQLPSNRQDEPLDVLENSEITHCYYDYTYEGNFLAPGVKKSMRAIVTKNREKHSRFLLSDAHAQNAVIMADTKSWFVPTEYEVNKQWAWKNGLKTPGMREDNSTYLRSHFGSGGMDVISFAAHRSWLNRAFGEPVYAATPITNMNLGWWVELSHYTSKHAD
jgi:hypothetical protein